MKQTLSSEEILAKIQEVSSMLEDEQSKTILEIRKKHNMDPSLDLLPQLIQQSTEKIKSFNPKYVHNCGVAKRKASQFKDKPFIFYGIGARALFYYQDAIALRPFIAQKEHFFCDKRYAEVPSFQGQKVISPEELYANYSDCNIIVSSLLYAEEICDQLTENHIPVENIHRFFIRGDFEEQYFDPDIISLGTDEVFVDAGVMNGATSVLFARKCNQKYEKIFLFEPSSECREETKVLLSKHDLKNHQLFPVGLWNEKDTLSFGGSAAKGAFGINKGEADIVLPVDSLDHLLGDERVTFIKMDIEGAELEALEGCENLIRKHKPKLAISLYHKPEDIYEIPLLIKSFVPEYKLYIRHYSEWWNETVLYAL